MIYVKIERGVIVNRAVFDGEIPSDWPDRDNWQQSDAAQIGWFYRDGQFLVPEPPPIPVPSRPLIRKSLIVERLYAGGKLAAAKTALDADLYARERWYAADKPAIYADDQDALALLQAIGADPDVILAPE